jgi:hypothetical protein
VAGNHAHHRYRQARSITIDPNRFQELGHGISTTPANVLAVHYLPPPPVGGAPENPNTPPKMTANGPLNPIGPTQDNISLLGSLPEPIRAQQ